MQRILGCCVIVPKALLPLSHQIGLAKGCLSPSFDVSQNVLCPLGETWVMAWDSHICLGLPALSQIWLFLKVRITGLNWNQLLLLGGKKKKRIEAIDYKITTHLQNKNVEWKWYLWTCFSPHACSSRQMALCCKALFKILCVCDSVKGATSA